MTTFAVVPVWAVEELSAQHHAGCHLCGSGSTCLIGTVLAGSLEDGPLPEEPTRVGDLLPDVLADLQLRQQRRINEALNRYTDEPLFSPTLRDGA